MPALRELQRAFARYVFEGDDSLVLASIRSEGQPQQGLAVYRNDVFNNLREALRAVFPVVDRLVGADFFGHAADRFIASHPSRSGNLHDFGRKFPDFLARFPGTTELGYLPDTARLEWLLHESFHAANHDPLELGRLGQLAPEHYPLLAFRLHPACRLLASPYPVQRIWQANQPEVDADESVDASSGGIRLLIRRAEFNVEMQPLTEGEYALLSAIAEGRNLGEAAAAAAATEPEFDLAAALGNHVRAGTLVDFELKHSD
jgi:hypothetical protein